MSAAIRAGLTDIMPVECSCTRMIAQYRALGRWVEDDGYLPAAGDLIFYDWEDSGKGDCTGQPNHMGMVEAASGAVMTVIEGNYNSMVQRRTLKVNGRYIRGFSCPDYASKAAGSTPGREDDDMKYYQKLADVPKSYRPSVQKVMELEVLKGSSDPDPTRLDDNVIDVSKDLCRTLTVLDRLGLLK